MANLVCYLAHDMFTFWRSAQACKGIWATPDPVIGWQHEALALARHVINTGSLAKRAAFFFLNFRCKTLQSISAETDAPSFNP